MKAKFLIPILAIALLTGCSPQILYLADTTYIDYSIFAADGIFLSESNSVSFEYTPIGSVSVMVYSGNVKAERISRYQYEDNFGNHHSTETYDKWKEATPMDAIKLAVEKAKTKGGNGIINLQIKPITDYTDAKNPRSGILVTGMVINKSSH